MVGRGLKVKLAYQPGRSSRRVCFPLGQPGVQLCPRGCVAPVGGAVTGEGGEQDGVWILRELTAHWEGMFEGPEIEPVPKVKATRCSLEGLKEGEFKART